MSKKLPSFLKASLWSFDLKKLDSEKHKAIIIEHILNHGGDKEVKWLLRNYKKEDIIKVLKNPSRGFWFKNSLNFWCLIFNVKMDEKHERAIKKIYPST